MAEEKSATNQSTYPAQNQRSHSDCPTPQSGDRERNLDKTIADSFPASDPPSSDPNPQGDEA